jgi:hypothetical protein
MYVQIDIQVAEAIIHAIGRKQAEEEAIMYAGIRKPYEEEANQGAQPSLLARIIGRLTARPADADAARHMPESDPSLACE